MHPPVLFIPVLTEDGRLVVTTHNVVVADPFGSDDGDIPTPPDIELSTCSDIIVEWIFFTV